MQNVTKDTYQSFLQNAKSLAVLDYWAVWCGPCAMLSPIVEELANENPEISFGKVNVDEEGELAMQAMVDSIPTLIAFKDGKEVKRFVGYRPKDELQKALEALV